MRRTRRPRLDPEAVIAAIVLAWLLVVVIAGLITVPIVTGV